MRTRLLSLLLAMTVLLWLAIPGAVRVSAEYENTYQNTGDQRADLIGVALTQVGYREGSNNYTKYGQWYGRPNDPWCGMFVSWCADQAGIPESVIKKAGIASPSSFGFSTYYTSAEYMPSPGDLFFNKSFSHMGIVYYVDGDYIYTLEGNTNDSGEEGIGVFCRKRPLSNFYYVSPDYNSAVSHNYIKEHEKAHPHKEYYRCTICQDTYYTGNTISMEDCKTCIAANCKHSYGSWTQVNDSTHKRVCSLCDKQETGKHDWDSGKVTKDATCSQSGSMTHTCRDCGAERTVTVARTDDHDYSQWAYMDAQSHSRVCAVCNRQELETHAVGTQWSADETEHWQDCEGCGERVGLQVHDFGQSCEEPCQVCAFARAEGHLYAESWSSDADGHWHTCESCGEKGSVEAHTYADKCDDTGSWRECTACGHVTSYAKHIPGPAATEQAAQTCTQCGYELAPMLAHVHRYDPIQSDRTTHWGQCACNQTLGPEPHVWDMGSGKCAVCRMDSLAVQEPVNWDFVWVIAGAAAACGIIILITVTVSKKKKAKPMAELY